MLLLLLACSASMSHEDTARVHRVVKKDTSERRYAAGRMRNQLDLSSQHSGQCEIGAHLPNLIFLGNRFQLLLPILCSHSYSFALYFSFHLALGVLLLRLCEIFRVFFLALICCILRPNTCAPLWLCNFHSSFPFTRVYLQNHPRSFVHPYINVFLLSLL